MKSGSLFFALGIALTATLCAPAAAAPPPPAIMATINGALARGNADDASGLNAYFTASSIVIDDFPPYLWTGPNAAAKWWHALDSLNAMLHVTKLHFTIGNVTQVYSSTGVAYASVPLTITYLYKGTPQKDTGMWAVTLKQTGATWKIVSGSWASISSTLGSS